jgi:enoyl-[acyl-carrier protein] reductase I
MLLEGKRGLVFGVANDRSIAWAIAKESARNGAKLALPYQDQALEKRVLPLAASINAPAYGPCDATNEAHIRAAMDRCRSDLGAVDFLVHSIAFADRQDLQGGYFTTTRDGFMKALEVSAFTLTLMVRIGVETGTLKPTSSVVAMSYIGGIRVVPRYNVMGVAKAALESSVRYLAYDLGPRGTRVNAISAGPIRTLSSAAISGFAGMRDFMEANAPLRRNVTAEEVAKVAVFLFSDMSSGITGDVLYVDAGYHVTATPTIEPSGLPHIKE